MVSRSSRRIWELSHQSVDQLVALLKRLRIRCDLKTRDAVYCATSAHAAERLRHECDLRSAVWVRCRVAGCRSPSPADRHRRSWGDSVDEAALSSIRIERVSAFSALPPPPAHRCSNGQRYDALNAHTIGVRIRTREGTLRRRPRGHRDRLCDASVSAVGGTVSDVSDVRPGDRADRQVPTRRRRSVRRHGLGHRAALPLCSLDTGASTAAGRRGPPGTARSTASSTVRDRITRSTGVLRSPTACSGNGANRTCVGRPVRDDRRQPSVHRPTPSVSASLVRPRATAAMA